MKTKLLLTMIMSGRSETFEIGQINILVLSVGFSGSGYFSFLFLDGFVLSVNGSVGVLLQMELKSSRLGRISLIIFSNWV